MELASWLIMTRMSPQLKTITWAAGKWIGVLGIWIAVAIPRQLEMIDDVRREAVEVAKWLDFAKNRRA